MYYTLICSNIIAEKYLNELINLYVQANISIPNVN